MSASACTRCMPGCQYFSHGCSFITPLLFGGPYPLQHLQGQIIAVFSWQLYGQIFFRIPDSRYYFNRIRQVAPTAQEWATTTLERIPTALVQLITVTRITFYRCRYILPFTNYVRDLGRLKCDTHISVTVHDAYKCAILVLKSCHFC